MRAICCIQAKHKIVLLSLDIQNLFNVSDLLIFFYLVVVVKNNSILCPPSWARADFSK